MPDPRPGNTCLAPGVLRVQRCADCGAFVFIPQPVCTSCFGDDLAWVETSGRGTGARQLRSISPNMCMRWENSGCMVGSPSPALAR